MNEAFTVLMIEDVEGKPKAGFRTLKLTDLSDHDVLVEVALPAAFGAGWWFRSPDP